MQFERVNTNQFRSFLNVDNYKFIYKSSSKQGDKEYYKCKDCNIYITLDLKNNSISHNQRLDTASLYPQHQHRNHKKEIVNSKVRFDCKSAIANRSNINLRSVYNSSIEKHIEDKNILKEFHQVQSSLQKFKAFLMPQQPASRSLLNTIDPRYVTTADDEPFLLANDGKFF